MPIVVRITIITITILQVLLITLQLETTIIAIIQIFIVAIIALSHIFHQKEDLNVRDKEDREWGQFLTLIYTFNPRLWISTWKYNKRNLVICKIWLKKWRTNHTMLINSMKKKENLWRTWSREMQSWLSRHY